MRTYHPLLKVGGPVLGAILVYFLITTAVSQFQLDQELARQAAQAEPVSEEPQAPPAADTASTPQTADTTSEAAPPAAAQPVAAAQTAAVDVTSAFGRAGCAGCHVIPGIPGANGQVGPDLSAIGVDGGNRIQDVATTDYIRQSILDPNAFIAPACGGNPCPPNVMLQSFAATLSSQDLDTIVGYLATLGTADMALLATTPREPVAMDTGLPAESLLEPFMALPSGPPSAVQIALGKYLFFDQRLSGNVSLSCASCHQPENAFADGQALSKGYPSTNYFRNTRSLYNTAFADYRYWDGRMDGGDLPTLVRDHLTEAHFMSMDGRLMAERLIQVPSYVDLFNQAFGGEPTFGRVLNAIAAYVSTLNSPAVAYDSALAGDTSQFTADELAGYELFSGRAGCSECHAGPQLTANGFYNTGVGSDSAMLDDPERAITFRRFFRTLGVPNYRNLRVDVGRFAIWQEPTDLAAFNTPGLREVGRTAPYMHDGSLATLEDVVRFYSAGGGPTQTAGLEPLNLNDSEIGQLVAFLQSLDSDPIAVSVPTLPDYEILALGGE